MKNLYKITVTMMICFFIGYSAFADVYPEPINGDKISTDIIIEVSGPQSGVWVNGNEYHVIDDVSVPISDTLIIEPGVIVKFMDYYSLKIYGTFIATGTETEHILFTSGRPNCNQNDWITLKFEDSSNDNSIISYVIIEYSCYGVYCSNSSPIINNNIMINGNSLGVLCQSSASPTITNNTIANNSKGIYCNSASSPIINNNTLSNNEYGIYCRANSSPNIFNNILYRNNTGINAVSEPSTLEYNLFWENNTTATGVGLPDDFGEIVTVNSNEDPCDIYYNLFMDPLFVYPGNFNFHLMETSPCIDAGDPDPVYYDPDYTISDIGAFYFDHTQLQAIFLADTTLGSIPLSIQFSDYSYSPDSIVSWQWDFNNDGTIDSEEQNPEWIYTEIGIYTVSLTVSDGENEDTEINEDYITVLEAGTYIPNGSVSGIWTHANSPYFIIGEIEIELDEQLTIEPGVTIIFMDYYSLTINGTLIAVGTESDSIVFTSGQPICNPDDWSGIKFEDFSNDNSIISFSRIEYAHYGIHCYKSSPSINNNTFINNDRGIYCNNNSSPSISNNTLINNDGGVYCNNNSSPTITYNTISNNNVRGISCSSSTPTISNNTISNNYDGILCASSSFATVTNNTIDNNFHGICCSSSSASINNNILNNNEYGIHFSYSSALINNNLFNDNGDGIFCDSESSPIIKFNTINSSLFAGIFCVSMSSPTIENNTIDNCVFGIFCDSESSPIIKFNTINNGGDGISCNSISSPNIDNNTINNNNNKGINCDEGSSPTISNNSISNNEIGIHCYYESSPIINNNNINENEHGIFCDLYSLPIISNNTISNSYDGIECYDYSSPVIENNYIKNITYAIECWFDSSPTIKNNIIIDNFTGIYIRFDSSPDINKNTFINNNRGFDINLSSHPQLVNNIFYDNGVVIQAYTSPSLLEHNLFWDNINIGTGSGLPTAIGVITTVNANEDPCDIYYNLFMDPLFVDPGNLNLHLLEDSPCIDAGNPDPVYFDPDGSVADIGAFYFNQTQVLQQISLSSGFSFVSSHIIPDNPDMIIVMDSALNENLDFVRNSQGQALQKIGPNWVNGIGDWIISEGYLVKMYAADSFTINGTQVDPTTPIPAEQGFQFVSYFPENAMDALLAFETIIGDDLDFVRNSQGQTLRKIGPNWVNGIGDCKPSEGYLVKMFAEGEIIYPISAKSSGKTTLNPTYFSFEGGNPAEPVYSIYINGLEIGDEVAAFDGEKMIGATRINSENAFENELPVFTTLTKGKGYEAGNPIILKVWSENEIVTADFTMEAMYNSYISDVYPDEDGKYSIVNITKGSLISDDEILVFPNPATENISIISTNEIFEVSILNNFGQQVYESKINDINTQINTSNLESGIYIIKIKTINGLKTHKLIIK